MRFYHDVLSGADQLFFYTSPLTMFYLAVGSDKIRFQFFRFMDKAQENRLDLIVTRAWDSALANAQNGTTYSSWRNNPALKGQYTEDGTYDKSDKRS